MFLGEQQIILFHLFLQLRFMILYPIRGTPIKHQCLSQNAFTLLVLQMERFIFSAGASGFSILYDSVEEYDPSRINGQRKLQYLRPGGVQGLALLEKIFM